MEIDDACMNFDANGMDWLRCTQSIVGKFSTNEQGFYLPVVKF